MTPPRPTESDARSGAADDAAQADPVQDDAARELARRKRRVDEVFGDVFMTGDERDSGRHDGFPRSHYEASRPPHWGVKQ